MLRVRSSLSKSRPVNPELPAPVLHLSAMKSSPRVPSWLRLVSGLLLAPALPAVLTAQSAPQDNWTLDRVVTVDGFAKGLINEPVHLSVLSDGRIAVTDWGNARVSFFDQTGNALSGFGSAGSGDGQLSGPTGIAELKDGNLAVVEYHNARVQVFSKNGTFIRRWGKPGNGDGEFSGPMGAAVLPDGKLVVCDGHNQRIQIFEPDGTYVRKWTTGGFPYAATIIQDGRIAVACHTDHVIRVYNQDGSIVRQFGSYGTLDGQFNTPIALATMPDGKVLVAEREGNRIQILFPDGSYVRKWGRAGDKDGEFSHPWGAAVSAEGKIFIADRYNHRIQVFSDQGSFISKMGSFGSSDPSLGEVRNLDSDGDGNIILMTRGGGKPHFNLISPAGQVIRRFSFNRAYDCYPMFRAENGKIYVGYNSHFEVYNYDGTKELSVGSPNTYSSANGLFGNGWVIPVPGADGTIYVADCGNSRVQVFSSTGTFIRAFGEPGTGPGQMSETRSIGIAPDGSIMVFSCCSPGRVQKFSPAGALQEILSYEGPGWGEPSAAFFAPDGLYFRHAYVFRSDRVPLMVANGFSTRTGEFYRVDGTNKIQIWRRGFRTLGSIPPKAVPAPGVIATKQRTNGYVDIDYTVTDADSATVTTALVAYRGGSTLIKDLVPLKVDALVESTSTKVGVSVPTGVVHRVTWNPANSGLYSGDLVFEVLARDGRPKLVDIDYVTVPTSPSITISRSPLLNSDFNTIWAWLLATGDSALTRAGDGEVVGPGGVFTVTSNNETKTNFPGRSWLFAKLGVREATADEVQKAKMATSTSGSPNQFTPGPSQRMGSRPAALNEWTFDSSTNYGSEAWWVVPLQ